MKSWLQLSSVTLIAGWLLATASTAGTSDVLRLQAVITGVTQWDLNNNPNIPRAQSIQIHDVDLINLGLGQALTNKIKAHEYLALVTQCASNDMRIIVYNSATQSNLVTIGKLQAVSVIESPRSSRYTRNVISALTFNFAANPTNALAGGMCFAAGSILADSNQCLLGYHANIIGALGSSFFYTKTIVTNIVDITVTNSITNSYLVVTNFPVNISRTTLTAGGKKLGILIEP